MNSSNLSNHRTLDWTAFGLWVSVAPVMSLVGLVLEYVVAVLFRYGPSIWPSYVLFGLVFGIAGGIAQSFVLGRWVAQPILWILATAFGEAVSFGGFAFTSYINGSLWDSLLIVGLAAYLLAWAQWLFLRRWVKGAAWWIPATVIGRVLGVILLFSVVGTSEFGLGFDAVLALQTPLALMTGSTLMLLFRHTEEMFQPNVSPSPLGLQSER